MSSAEEIRSNFGALETANNNLDGLPLDQALVAAQRLQVHATLALGGAILLVAEEIANLRVALTEQ